ncbi:hypothetical protein D210916BOD24_01390 [Alteromonas sp. D210916BOD_24]|uniref:Spy/CpxP family protein refolding chaperone n=1 Tax=Alteromonas sp. D210916BOD_24 TaxID=3157618 RepID=UPI00399D336D
MKKLLIASATIATISLSGLAMAKPTGPNLSHPHPFKEMASHLRGLSLSDSQREQIKTLVRSFKASHPTEGFRRDYENIIDFTNASEAEISQFVKTTFEARENKHFDFAQLRHGIFNILTPEQKAKILARQENVEPTGEPRKKHKMFAKHDGKDRRDPTQRGNKRSLDKPRSSFKEDSPFRGIALTEAQLTALASLEETYEDTASANRETMHNFRDAQRSLIRSEAFSKDTWNALVETYKADLIGAGIAKIKHRQAMFAVLTDDQQATLKARHKERRELHELLIP